MHVHTKHICTYKLRPGLNGIGVQPNLAFPDNIRSLFGAIPGGGLGRGATISGVAGPGFTTGADLANQTHAQAGTRAGGWAEGMASSATAVSSLAGTAPLLLFVKLHQLAGIACMQ